MQHLYRYPRIAILLVGTLLLASLGPTHQAYAATIAVTTFADNLVTNGDCWLREAIQAANTNSVVDACQAAGGTDTIELGDGIYNVESALSVTLTNVTSASNTGCPATDQRGMSRPHSLACDIGAYEENTVPQAVADSFSTAEDTPLIVTIPGVLANDSDPDNDVITATLVTTPTHGALALTSNGAFSYIPSANYHGPDSFSYRVDDGCFASASVPVALTITSVNDPPIAGNDTATTPIDTQLIIPATLLLGNDTDIEGDPLTISEVRGNSARGGRVPRVGGDVVYTPPTHFSGVDSLIYTVNDGNGGTASGTVNITVEMRLLYMPIARR
ncbi:MAG TPA: tandem-95 repeat protein [Roseiflexaceae bacterium]|nr:tandem-95 repeat protein [Roseiflexaceae bacterium]